MKLNLTMCKLNYIPWQSRIYSKYASVVTHWKNDQYNPPHQQDQEEKSYGHTDSEKAFDKMHHPIYDKNVQ